VTVFSDYTDRLLHEEKPGNTVNLTLLRGTETLSVSVKVGESLFPNQPSGKDDWAIVLPDYYYMASKKMHNSVHFVKDMKYYSFENFDLRYNRPEVVIERLGFASPAYIQMYKKAYLKRIRKMGFQDVAMLEKVTLPEVSLRKHAIPAETTQGTVTVSMKAYSYGANIDRLNVYVNDVPIFGAKGKTVASKQTKDLEETLAIPLTKGKNKIQVSVHDSRGIESLKETVEVLCKKTTQKPTLYVVTIGVSNYKDSEYNLTYAAKDARDLSNIFEANKAKYAGIKKFSFLNEQATKENILKTKNELMQSQVDDEVILFVAGHGLLDDKLDYYFATNNVDFYNPSEKGLKYEELENLLDGIPARKKLMLIDACHSGEVDKDATPSGEGNTTVATVQNIENGSVKFRGFKKDKSTSLGFQNSFELMKELFADLRRGTGAMVISSASGAEFAFESDRWNNGVFTYSVLEALRKSATDVNYDGHIQVSELRDYVIRRVSELTGGRQHPTSRNENLEFDFSVW
jgi:hypothetical protein